MKKRVLAGILMMVLVLSSAMMVSAADSKTGTLAPNGSSAGKYDVTVDPTNGVDEYDELTDASIDKNDKIPADKKDEAKKTAKEAVEKIQAINDGKTVTITKEVDDKIEGKKLVQKFFDLDEVGNHDACHAAGKHVVELKVDAMTASWKNIVVVHFSADRVVWETIVPTVDYEKKTLTFEIKDLSPLAIYADVVGDGTVGTSPSTEGVSSTWMLWTAMALIVLGSGVVASQKKRF